MQRRPSCLPYSSHSRRPSRPAVSRRKAGQDASAAGSVVAIDVVVVATTGPGLRPSRLTTIAHREPRLLPGLSHDTEVLATRRIRAETHRRSRGSMTTPVAEPAATRILHGPALRCRPYVHGSAPDVGGGGAKSLIDGRRTRFGQIPQPRRRDVELSAGSLRENRRSTGHPMRTRWSAAGQIPRISRHP